MTTTTDGYDRCANCPSSAEGCHARAAARYGHCCSRCSHPAPVTGSTNPPTQHQMEGPPK